MGFLGESFRKIGVAFTKQFVLEKDAEIVDIRFESLSEWLYKITLKSTVDLKSIGQDHRQEIEAYRKELNIVADALEMKKIFDSTISRYKLETIAQQKTAVIAKIRNLFNESADNPKTVEGYRVYFDDLQDSLNDFLQSVNSNALKLKEYFSKEIDAVFTISSKMQESINDFQVGFKNSNDDRVANIVKMISNLKKLMIKDEDLEREVAEIDALIDKSRNHIYKLSDKLEVIKSSPRFKEVIEKESRMGNLLTERDDHVQKINDSFSKVEKVLVQYAEKKRQQGLVREYLNHTQQAIELDNVRKIEAILEDLAVEIGNKRTVISKSLGDSASEMSEKVEKAKATVEDLGPKVKELNERIRVVGQSLKNYVILNEFEDTTSRIKFYQEKLQDTIAERERLLREIEILSVENEKERLHKEILLLTGYDVHIIYESESENATA